MNFRFWQKESPSTTVAMEDLPDGFVDVSTPTSDYIYIPNENPSVEVLQPVRQPQEAPVHVIQKNIKKERWERQYPKIFATARNSLGESVEIRHVNQNKQLAYWDSQKQLQIYVYSSKTNQQELITQNKEVLSRMR